MSYAQITNDTIDRTGGLPKSARRLDTGDWVLGLRSADQPTREACGWYEIADTARPDDTDTTTHDRSVELVDGTPTVTWTERDKTDDELNPPPTIEEQLEAALAIIAGEET